MNKYIPSQYGFKVRNLLDHTPKEYNKIKNELDLSKSIMVYEYLHDKRIKRINNEFFNNIPLLCRGVFLDNLFECENITEFEYQNAIAQHVCYGSNIAIIEIPEKHLDYFKLISTIGDDPTNNGYQYYALTAE